MIGSTIYNLGFTGTDTSMTVNQDTTIRSFMRTLCFELSTREIIAHHGGCIGADHQFNEIARKNGVQTHVYPCNIKGKQAASPCRWRELEKDPLERNKDIVFAAKDLMLATPRENFEALRSGTWATIRYSHQMARALVIVWPDGEWETHRITDRMVTKILGDIRRYA